MGWLTPIACCYGDDGDKAAGAVAGPHRPRETMRLPSSAWNAQLHGIFFTHMHTDHTEGFADLVTLRSFFNGAGPKLDAVGRADVVSPRGSP